MPKSINHAKPDSLFGTSSPGGSTVTCFAVREAAGQTADK